MYIAHPCRFHFFLLPSPPFNSLLFCILYFVFQNTEIDPTLFTIIRSAFIGLCASSISDICSNSLRVLKTTKQTAGIESVENIKNTVIVPINNLNVLNTVQTSTNEKEIITEMKSEMKDEITSDKMKIFNAVSEENTAVKNTKIESKSYIEIAKDIIAVDGIGGLLGRGLQVNKKIRCYFIFYG